MIGFLTRSCWASHWLMSWSSMKFSQKKNYILVFSFAVSGWLTLKPKIQIQLNLFRLSSSETTEYQFYYIFFPNQTFFLSSLNVSFNHSYDNFSKTNIKKLQMKYLQRSNINSVFIAKYALNISTHWPKSSAFFSVIRDFNCRSLHADNIKIIYWNRKNAYFDANSFFFHHLWKCVL